MPAASKSFYDVLTAAIADMAEHGFDSQERVAFWTRQIKEAAERVTKSQAQMEQMLKDAMVQVYRKMVEKGQVLRYHPGVARFTLERLRPALRSELDRRIMASASLIKLNKEAAIDQTLRRFAGWSTSIPAGGSASADKSSAKKDVKKALASYPFEVRRVLIDQGTKLSSALSDIIATNGGAIAATWRHHHVNQPRPAHVARDGDVFLIRGSWAHEQGLVKPNPKNGYTDDIEKPGELVYCRCSYVYIYNLRDVPKDMLTKKGAEALASARAKIGAM